MRIIKLHNISARLYQKGYRTLASLISAYITRCYRCVIYPQTHLGGGTIFGYGGIGVVIHKDTWIGDNVTIAQNVTIASKDGGAPRIGDNTYIGANSVIIGNISIGKNVFIGALSLVNKDVPDNAICYGIPSKVIRFRSEEELAVFKEWSERQRK